MARLVTRKETPKDLPIWKEYSFKIRHLCDGTAIHSSSNTSYIIIIRSPDLVSLLVLASLMYSSTLCWLCPKEPLLSVSTTLSAYHGGLTGSASIAKFLEISALLSHRFLLCKFLLLCNLRNKTLSASGDKIHNRTHSFFPGRLSLHCLNRGIMQITFLLFDPMPG